MIWSCRICVSSEKKKSLNHAASAHVATAVVGLGALVLLHTRAGCVDKLERAVLLVDLGDNAHVANAVVHCASVEEHEVTRLQLIAVHATAVVDLPTRSAVEAEAEALEHITREARAVKRARRHGTMTIGRATILVGVVKDFLHQTFALTAVLLQLLGHGALLAGIKHLCFTRQCAHDDCHGNYNESKK